MSSCSDSDDSRSKKIIIPKGSIRPNETVVIEIPSRLRNNAVVLAKRRSASLPCPRACSPVPRPPPRAASPVTMSQSPRPPSPQPGPSRRRPDAAAGAGCSNACPSQASPANTSFVRNASSPVIRRIERPDISFHPQYGSTPIRERERSPCRVRNTSAPVNHVASPHSFQSYTSCPGNFSQYRSPGHVSMGVRLSPISRNLTPCSNAESSGLLSDLNSRDFTDSSMPATDSSGEMNTELFGKVVGGEMGRVLVWPTPPGGGSPRRMIINPSGNANQPNLSGNTNQPNLSGNANRPNLSGNGNQPNLSGNGNQPNLSGSPYQQNLTCNANHSNLSSSPYQPNLTCNANKLKLSGSPYQQNLTCNVTQPNLTFNTTQPNQTCNTTQPNQTFNTAQPNQTFTTAQPNQTFNTARPNQTFNATQPNQTFNATQPNQTFNTTQPNQTFNTTQPNQTFNTTQPNLTYNRTPPNQTFNAMQPDLTYSSTSPNLTFNATQPNSTVIANQPNLTYGMNQSNTTYDVNQPNVTCNANRGNLTSNANRPNSTFNTNRSNLTFNANQPNVTYNRSYGPCQQADEDLMVQQPAKNTTYAASPSISSREAPDQSYRPLFASTPTRGATCGTPCDHVSLGASMSPIERDSMYNQIVNSSSIESFNEQTIEDYESSGAYDSSGVYDSSGAYDSSGEMNTELLGRVIGGDVGRVLVWPTPPGGGSPRRMLIQPNLTCNTKQPSANRTYIATPPNDPNNSYYPCSNSSSSTSGRTRIHECGERLYDSSEGEMSSDPLTWSTFAGVGATIPLGCEQNHSHSRNVQYVPGRTDNNATTLGAVTQKCSDNQNKKKCTCHQRNETGFDHFCPSADSEVKTCKKTPRRRTRAVLSCQGNSSDASEPSTCTTCGRNDDQESEVIALEQMEAAENNILQTNLRNWQEARRRLILESTKMTSSNSSINTDDNCGG